MILNRREVLQSTALCGLASVFSGCGKFVENILGDRLPEKICPSLSALIDPGFHLLSRAGFGPRPGDLNRLREKGPDAWIEEQLEPEHLKDKACELRAERFESVFFAPGDAYEFRKPVLRAELTRHALLRAVYSQRQLFEAMVEFWTDHLNIDLEKGDCVYLKPSDDRDVIRRHALGNFHDLIRASATSPAMLVYLDGRANKVRRDSQDRPNENYARELMELHTMGVHNGYTQQDVVEAARCLSGWTFDAKRTFALNQNTAFFRPDWHDDGSKNVLGETIPAGGGAADLDALVRIVCSHPSTSKFIATKLCRHFVSVTPPTTLVERVAREFERTKGDIKSLLRIILKADEFYASRGQLLKRPFKFTVSALRATGAETAAEPGILEPLHRMGHGLFQYPTPEGYPESEMPWMGTLLWRWNFALALGENRQAGVQLNMTELSKSLDGKTKMPTPELWFAHCVGRSPSAEEMAALGPLAETGGAMRGSQKHGIGDVLGVVLASPAFQRC
jgi:hypothetical protein